MSEDKKGPVSRRNFLKIAGLAGAAAQTGGLVAAGVAAGKSSETYTGWESFNPGTQFFNREPFEFESPAHRPVGKVRRPSHITDYVFGRVAMFQRAYEANPDWKLEDPLEELDLMPQVIAFYKEFPERLEWDFRTFSETVPNNRKDHKEYGNYYKLAEAYSSGFTYHGACLPRPQTPPEESDFTITRQTPRGRVSCRLASEPPSRARSWPPSSSKKSLTASGQRSSASPKPILTFSIPKGGPAAPRIMISPRCRSTGSTRLSSACRWNGTSFSPAPRLRPAIDGYDRVSTAAVRLEGALKSLGYPARNHAPMTSYDLVVPPLAVEAGLGEVARTGYCVTPELGGNCRMAVVTTSLPMATDKPIHFGVEEFCNKCKLCAESCPSGAIPMDDSPKGMTIRGYEHWYINNGACYNYWRESMGPMGCRLCVAVCPYSRKDNWIHSVAREVDPRDPTGVASTGLLFLQKNFFDYPEAEEYRRPPDGHFASYRPEPTFLHAERYLDIDIVSPHGD